ncbi:MAG: aminoglycoside phosphotransferase family protein, partial [Bacillota bacterium]|nr:aminoglycoside phosphotransferase family protein [Bacillota bacterium]
ESQCFFLKIMHTQGRQALFINGLRVVDALVRQGIDFIPEVIKLISGEFYFMKDGSAVALFTVVPGKQNFNYNREDVFRKLALIHRTSENITERDGFLHEDFNDWFIEAYESELEKFMKGNIEGTEALEVKAMLKPYEDFLAICPQIARDIVSECKNDNSTFYITHSDFPGNVMVTETGQQYLIDFDEAIFGPLERDSWICIAPQDEYSELYMSVIEEVFPDYMVNKTFMRFYIYQRFMIDLNTFMHDLVHSPDEEYRKKIVSSTRDYMLGWLYPLLIKNS